MKCTIIIEDEVNCKLHGLDIATKRKCINALKYKLPYARHLPAVKLGRWDGCVNFFSVGGGTQINLLNDILEIIINQGYEVEIIDKRPKIEFSIPKIDKDYLSFAKWPADHSRCPNEPIVLEEHQVNAVNTFIDNLQGAQVLATSAGKTIITAALSKSVEAYGRTITIVPNTDLVYQTHDDYKMIGLDVGMYHGKEKSWHLQHTICTWQSLNVLIKNTQNGITEEGFAVDDFAKGVVAIIVDEAHNINTTSEQNILRKMLTTVFSHIPIRWAMTGTWPKDKHTQASIISSVGYPVGEVSAKELQDKGFLSKCEVKIIQTQEERKFKTYHEEIDFLSKDKDRLNWFAQKIMAETKATGNSLILVGRKKTGRELEKLIPDSVFVDGDMDVKDRKKEYKDVATMDNKVIIATYGVAAVGLNIPRIRNLFLYEAGKAFTRVIQSIGRGLRKAQDKDFVMIWDVCSKMSFSKRHLTTRKSYYKEAQYPFTIEKVSY